MPAGEFAIPAHVRQNVVAWFGAGGLAWLDAAPRTIKRLVDEWGLTLHEPLHGGSVSVVLAVRRGDRTVAVLKLPFIDEESRHEAEALRHYNGAGAVQLYAFDQVSGAMLLEKLSPGTGLDRLDDPEQAIVIATDLLRRLWRPPAADHPFALVRDLATLLAEDLPSRNDRCGSPLPLRLVEESVALARALAASAEDDVVVNRDAHLANILAAEREPWLLIDPKPLVGERAFDGGYLLLDRLGPAPRPDSAGALLRTLAQALGVERERLRAWALLRAVDNVLWAIDVNAPPGQHLAQAHALANGLSGANHDRA